MFVTLQEKIDIYDKPSLSAKIIGQIGKDQGITVQGSPIVADGWVWHEVQGGNLWIIERNAEGSQLLLNMIWRGEWTKSIIDKLYQRGVAGIMQWGFSGLTINIGVGDANRGMHKPGDRTGVPTQDYWAMFNAYKAWGDGFWQGKHITD